MQDDFIIAIIDNKLFPDINLQLQQTETITALGKIREAVLAKVWHCNIKVVDIN